MSNAQSIKPKAKVETLGSILSDMMRGQTWFLAIYPFVAMFAFLGLAVYSAVEFFNATTTQDWIMWATIFMLSAITMAMLKIWFWLRYIRNSILRELAEQNAHDSDDRA